MQFGLAFRYFVTKPGGFTNLLLLSVCQFIPAIGPIVIMGYRAEVAEALDRDDGLRRHPDFDFGRFVEYLTRGVWPFVIGLILALPLMAVLFAAFITGMVIDAQGGGPPLFGFVLFAGAYAVVLPVYLALSVPMMFHAELTKKFDLGGAYRFAVGFWTLVGGRAVVTGLVFVPLAVVVTLVGLLCCFVGVYPANVIVQMAAEHLMVQLYREYVDRGGEPLTDSHPWAGDEEDDTDWR